MVLIFRSSSTLPHLGLVALVAEVAMVWAVVGMCPHVLTHVPDSLEQLAALATLVPALGHVHLHVLLQHVACQELLLTGCTLKWLVACKERKAIHFYWTRGKEIPA